MTDPKKLTIDAALGIEGQEDTTQLEVRGSATQTEPLQEWQNASGNAVARLGAEGRLQVGDLDLETPEAMIEANEVVTLPSDRPLRGIQTLGQISGAIGDAIAWVMAELQLLGSGGVSGLHAALRAVLTLDNSGGAADAEVRAGDFEVINASDPVAKAVGVSSAITNETDGTITEAVAFSVAPPINQGIIGTLVGLDVPDLDQADENFAIRTGKGQTHLGDFIEMEQLDTAPGGSSGVVRVYPKTDGKLYAKSPAGIEYDLTGGGGGGIPGDTVEDETSYGLSPNAGVADEYSRADHTHGSVGHDSHANLSGVTSDQHHAKSHAHNGADGSGTVSQIVFQTVDAKTPRSGSLNHALVNGAGSITPYMSLTNDGILTGANLIANGDFETGSLTNWTASVTSPGSVSVSAGLSLWHICTRPGQAIQHRCGGRHVRQNHERRDWEQGICYLFHGSDEHCRRSRPGSRKVV